MNWRERLVAFALAGGLTAGCSTATPGVGGGRCNANPDPCCPIDDQGTPQFPAGCAELDASFPDSGASACNANPDPCCVLADGGYQSPALCRPDAGDGGSDGAPHDASDDGATRDATPE